MASLQPSGGDRNQTGPSQTIPITPDITYQLVKALDDQLLIVQGAKDGKLLKKVSMGKIDEEKMFKVYLGIANVGSREGTLVFQLRTPDEKQTILIQDLDVRLQQVSNPTTIIEPEARHGGKVLFFANVQFSEKYVFKINEGPGQAVPRYEPKSPPSLEVEFFPDPTDEPTQEQEVTYEGEAALAGLGSESISKSA